jgi:hypothetical protein
LKAERDASALDSTTGVACCLFSSKRHVRNFGLAFVPLDSPILRKSPSFSHLSQRYEARNCGNELRTFRQRIREIKTMMQSTNLSAELISKVIASNSSNSLSRDGISGKTSATVIVEKRNDTSISGMDNHACIKNRIKRQTYLNL